LLATLTYRFVSNWLPVAWRTWPSIAVTRRVQAPELMKRMGKRHPEGPVGQEAPIVITPRLVARLLRQVVGVIRRKGARHD